ncbi:MAG: GNAT family N-acetyltransferase [Burkholderiales bacterium]|nr:GNAT family N-acetyltransferase [Burkholderiales bacterium]
MLIRPFKQQDESGVIALWHTCALTRSWNNPSLDKEDGLIIASAMFGYEGHRGWVNYLAVDPSHQRKGYATQLMEHGEHLLRAVGCPKLNLQVRSTNASTLAFYESLGYKNDEVISLGKRLISDG